MEGKQLPTLEFLEDGQISYLDLVDDYPLKILGLVKRVEITEGELVLKGLPDAVDENSDGETSSTENELSQTNLKIVKAEPPEDNVTTKDLNEVILTRPKENAKKMFACDFCKFTAYKAFDLLDHMRVHPGPKKYNCSECVFSTRTKFNLRRHKRRKHTKVCESLASPKPVGKVTPSKKNGIISLTEKSYRCRLIGCDFTASTAYDLRVHVTRHS